jgi:membrane associated rhomboid family serine protease
MPDSRWTARPATAALVAVCAVMFVLTWVLAGLRADSPWLSLGRALWSFDDTETLTALGALSSVRVWLDDEWWRVGSAGLLHGSWLHLGLNMLGLWSVGQWTEKAWGWWRQLLVFGVASLGGCAASLAWAEAPLVVGASAGIFGIAGGLVVARAWGRESIQTAIEPVSAKTLGFWLVFWLLVGAALPLFGISLLAQAGHLGGLVFGSLAGLACSVEPRRRGLRVGLWVTIALGLAAVLGASAAPTWRTNYHAFLGTELLERGQYSRAAGHFDEALERAGGAQADPGLANAVAYALAEAGVDLERAEDLVRTALVEEPDNADYLDTLGWILCQGGDVDGGREVLEAAKAAAEREIPEIDEHLDRCGGR